MDYAGKTALITGASGGIGEAFAALLAAEGLNLILAARSEKELSRVAGVLTTRHQVPVTVIPCDLATPEGVEDLCAEMTRRAVAPDIIINNAGRGVLGPVAETGRDENLGTIDLNVRALADLCYRFLPGIIARRTGGIINVASTAGFMPGPGMATYFATKNFVVAFSDALYHETKATGVTITCLCPGPVLTGFQRSAGMHELKRGMTDNTLSPEETAEAGWEAFKAGKRQVIPGFVNVLSAWAGRFLPRVIGLPFIARVVKDMK